MEHLIWRTFNCEGDSMWLWPFVVVPAVLVLGFVIGHLTARLR